MSLGRTNAIFSRQNQPQNVLGHSGKAKKGHLCFDAIYETGAKVDLKSKQTIHPLCEGNLGRVDFINDYEYDLFIRPDTCNPRYRLDLFNDKTFLFHSPLYIFLFAGFGSTFQWTTFTLTNGSSSTLST